MKNHEHYIDELKQCLAPLKPHKAILFGSYADGVPHQDSGIDLIIVLDRDKAPERFEERMANYSVVMDYFRLMNKNMPMDVIVYTKPDWNRFVESDSSFSREILEKGKQLT